MSFFDKQRLTEKHTQLFINSVLISVTLLNVNVDINPSRYEKINKHTGRPRFWACIQSANNLANILRKH